MELKFRKLRANEIDCRVATINEKGLSLLLYKDARCDMNILDETIGPLNWKREHTRENANCIVSIYDEDKKEWVSKEDTGTESFTEKEKGLASDSFKRSCFNWGIGRELYTAPFIWISKDNCNITKKDDGKYTTYDTFKVTKIDYNKDGEISKLEIENTKTHKIVYILGKTGENREKLIALCKEKGLNINEIASTYGLNPKSTEDDYFDVLCELDYATSNNPMEEAKCK